MPSRVLRCSGLLSRVVQHIKRSKGILEFQNGELTF